MFVYADYWSFFIGCVWWLKERLPDNDYGASGVVLRPGWISLTCMDEVHDLYTS